MYCISTYPDSVLSACTDPGGFGEIEEQCGCFVERVQLVDWGWPTLNSVLQLKSILTSMKTVPFCVGPL